MAAILSSQLFPCLSNIAGHRIRPLAGVASTELADRHYIMEQVYQNQHWIHQTRTTARALEEAAKFRRYSQTRQCTKRRLFSVFLTCTGYPAASLPKDLMALSGRVGSKTVIEKFAEQFTA